MKILIDCAFISINNDNGFIKIDEIPNFNNLNSIQKKNIFHRVNPNSWNNWKLYRNIKIEINSENFNKISAETVPIIFLCTKINEQNLKCLEQFVIKNHLNDFKIIEWKSWWKIFNKKKYYKIPKFKLKFDYFNEYEGFEVKENFERFPKLKIEGKFNFKLKRKI